MKGKFIVFEGIDGSGSSYQAKLLQDHLIKHNQKSILTCEPTNGPIGSLIRQIQLGRTQISEDDEKREKVLAYLFAADRMDHLVNDQNGIIKSLEKGYNVISTRYTLSSFAYHTFNDDFSMIYALNKDFVKPDLLIYLDCPVEVSMDRINNTRIADLNENHETLRRVKENYETAIDILEYNYRRIDATKSPQLVFWDVLKILNDIIN